MLKNYSKLSFMKALFKRDLSRNSFSFYPKNKTNDSANSILFNIISCGYEEIGKNYYLKRSEFHGNMLTYIKQGTGHLLFKNKDYNLKKNDLILINCMEEHVLYPNEEGMIIYYMHIDSNIVSDFAKSSSSVFNFSDDSSIENFFAKYIIRDHPEIDNSKYTLDLYEILIKIRMKVLGESNETVECPDSLKSAINFIKDNYHIPDLTLETIARNSNFNKYYLEKLFNKHLNTTVCNYLITTRLAAAHYLLLSTNYSIEEVSTKVGFSGSQVLIKYFKRAYKETPLQYKKKRSMETN